MKSVQYINFGQSDVLQLANLPMPEMGNEHDILIQVKAASVNPLDIKIRMGYMQQMRPVQLPYTPGLDAAGTVVAVGAAVTNFQVGDEVIAIPMGGGYAEYVVANENFVSRKPANLSFEQAASLAVNLGTAQSLLFTEGQLEKGQKVLIQGAAGAVGSTMVQLAKSSGLYVYATASGKGVDLVKELGADEVFDYKTTDVSTLVKDVDLVADTAGGASQTKLFPTLKSGGKLLSIATPPSADLAKQFGVNARFVSSNLTAKNMESALALVTQGIIKPIVSEVFNLEAAAIAQDRLSAGSSIGKIVLVVG
ncbi:MAG: zinc-binding dehydrogenase [Cryomorphaceae bacterium]|nr:zinc-binding dehydrogenase [Cryomorphaceae bacterium]